MVVKSGIESMLDESGFGAANEMGGFELYKVPEVSLAPEHFLHSSSLHQHRLEHLLNEVKMEIKKGSGANDTSGTLYSSNLPISLAAPKPLSSNMDSRSVLPTKTPSVASLNVYPPMSLKSPYPFEGSIKSNAVN